jgi:hypothetical protein
MTESFSEKIILTEKNRKKKKGIDLKDLRVFGKYGRFVKNDFVERKSLLD